MTITGESASKYRLIVDDDTYEVGKNKIYYFNPCALYETHKFSTLAPYMKSNYSKYVDYFNTQLHKPHKQVKKTLVPEKINDLWCLLHNNLLKCYLMMRIS